MSIGVENAGFEIKSIYETPGYSKNAIHWDLNRPQLKHSVVELDHEFDGFSRHKDIDLFYGNPPCSGLSSMTGSKLTSEANLCMRHWIRMVVKAEPKMILMENAYAFASDRVWPIRKDLADVLEDNGYSWWTWSHWSWQTGTPQKRRRTFLCATKLDIPNKEKIFDQFNPVRDPKMNVYEFIKQWEDIEPSPDNKHSHWYGAKNYDRIKGSFDKIDKYREIGQRLIGPRVKSTLKNGESGKYIYDENCPQEWDIRMMMFRPNFIGRTDVSGAIIGCYKYIHPTKQRYLTFREHAALMGYPDDFMFVPGVYDPNHISQGVPANNVTHVLNRFKEVLGVN